MSNYGSPRKFRSRYKTYHRQAAALPSSWGEWVDGKDGSGSRPGRLVMLWILTTAVLFSAIGGAVYGFVIH